MSVYEEKQKIFLNIHKDINFCLMELKPLACVLNLDGMNWAVSS